MRGGAAFALAAILAAAAFGQDSRPDSAERLHRLVDRRIEELRAELHREIDAALGRGTPERRIDAAAVTDEFRTLHRLPPGCGLRVRAESATIGSDLVRLEKGDVLVSVNGRAITGAADVVLAVADGGAGRIPDVFFIRRHQWMTVVGGTTWAADWQPIRLSGPGAGETAEQMVDRLWDEAVRNAVKTGLEEMRPQKPVAESQPAAK